MSENPDQSTPHPSSGTTPALPDADAGAGRTGPPPALSAEQARALTDEQWRRLLTPLQFQVLRQAGTERPFTGEYWDTRDAGAYACRACGAELFRSEAKFGSHCGWPSFYEPLLEDRVRYVQDDTLGMRRTEVRCANCESHLGHVFAGEGYDTPTDLRYCINSASLRLRPDDPGPDAPARPASAPGSRS